MNTHNKYQLAFSWWENLSPDERDRLQARAKVLLMKRNAELNKDDIYAIWESEGWPESSKNMNQLAVAIAITAEAFKSKTDKAGEPYILHCIRVMNNLHTNDEELQTIAILHDLVEDTDYTLLNLQSLGFSERVIQVVGLLTHDKNVSYELYIKNIALNQDARLVKLADLRDNSDITRLKGLTKRDIDRMEKYHWAYTYLSKV